MAKQACTAAAAGLGSCSGDVSIIRTAALHAIHD
jgi:hypothetical protein